MEILKIRTLDTEIFKTINNTIPSFMKYIFTPKRDPKIKPFDILVKHHKSAEYGDKSLKVQGPKIWNQLTSNVKSLTSITKFKEYVRTWFGPSCKCNICQLLLNRLKILDFKSCLFNLDLVRFNTVLVFHLVKFYVISSVNK